MLKWASKRFQLLTSNTKRTERQATLRGAIDWSWNLLTDWEKSALAQLSVFEGGWDLEAVGEVLNFDGAVTRWQWSRRRNNGMAHERIVVVHEMSAFDKDRQPVVHCSNRQYDAVGTVGTEVKLS